MTAYGRTAELDLVCCRLRRGSFFSFSPLFRGEKVGMRGRATSRHRRGYFSLSAILLWRGPLTPTLPPRKCMDRGHRGQFPCPVRGHRGHLFDFVERGISMAWREVSVIDQREEFVRLALAPGANKRELCKRFGISRSNGHKWLRRYALEGRAGLADRSRRPRCSPKRTALAIEAVVLQVRKDSNNSWGGRKIAEVLRDQGIEAPPAASTITEILRRHGKLEERAAEHPGSY